jgi:hypothetical protein
MLRADESQGDDLAPATVQTGSTASTAGLPVVSPASMAGYRPAVGPPAVYPSTTPYVPQCAPECWQITEHPGPEQT